MRRLLLVLVVSLGLVLAACVPRSPVPAPAIEAWKAELINVTPVSSPPPIIREVLNVGIRAGVPIVCPALVAQAAPEYQPFVTATCDAIVESDDPFTTTTTTLPALCAGDPPLGASVFPTLAPVLPATCPLLVMLPELLGLTQYLPGF